MKQTNIFVSEVTIDQMFNDEKNASYNPAEWAKKVARYSQFKGCQFYVSKADGKTWLYDRFFVKYFTKDNLLVLRQWDAFSASLSSNGFVRAHIVEGQIFTVGFGPDMNGRAENTDVNRKRISELLSANGIMVTNDL